MLRAVIGGAQIHFAISADLNGRVPPLIAFRHMLYASVTKFRTYVLCVVPATSQRRFKIGVILFYLRNILYTFSYHLPSDIKSNSNIKNSIFIQYENRKYRGLHHLVRLFSREPVKYIKFAHPNLSGCA